MATDFPTKGEDKKISLRNSNYPQFDYKFIANIKEFNPEIYKAGGNIRGNEAFNLWTKARDGEETDGVLDWIKEREAWGARHFEDGAQFKGDDKTGRPSNIAGIIAQMKWGIIGTLGEQRMKDIVLEAVKYLEEKDERKEEREVSDEVREALQTKVDEHNEEYGDNPAKRATLRMLIACFERGIGAYKTNPGSVRPGVSSPEQWAYARVNAFLRVLASGKYATDNKFDQDLLPAEHPESSKERSHKEEVIMPKNEKKERHILNVSETDNSYIVEFGKSEPMSEEMVESSESVDEARPYHYDEEEKKLSEEEVLRYYADRTVRQNMEIETRSIDMEARTMTLIASSESPVERSFGREILSHRADDIDMAFISSGKAPLLYNHDDDQQIGIIERFYLDEKNRVTVADVRFSKNQFADEVLRDINDNIRGNVSIGYQILGMTKAEDSEGVTYRCRFKPIEVSIVSIPADPTVGVLRNEEVAETVETPINETKEERKMTEEVKNETPVVEVSRNDVAKDIDQILEMGDAFGQQDLAREFVKKGATVEGFRSALLGKLKEKKAEVELANVDMSRKEQREYSLMNAIRAQITGNWKDAGLEREVSDELAKRFGKEARGIFMPMNLQTRDLTKGTDSAGGFLVPEQHLSNEFIDRLKANSVCVQAGARVMQSEGDLVIPRLASGADNVAFVAEGNAPTESALTFEQVSLSPKGLRGYVDISRILANNSSPDAEQIVRDDLIGTFAEKIDQVCIEGGASNEPNGVIADTNVPVVAIGTNGGAITYAKLIDMHKSVMENNASFSAPKFLINPATDAKLRQTLKSSGDTSSNFILGEDNRILGYDVLMSTNVPSDLTKGTGTSLSAILFGSFDQMLIANFSPVDVLVDPYSLSNAGSIRVNAYVDMDVALRHPESFAVIKDVDNS